MTTAVNLRAASWCASDSLVTAYTSLRLMGRPRMSLVERGWSETYSSRSTSERADSLRAARTNSRSNLGSAMPSPVRHLGAEVHIPEAARAVLDRGGRGD